ncbi:MAG: hypothetical protein J7M15_03665 [Anaerolineae bacterium]|nr:hypothetical protein [Anaerolineae bacterium]
MAHRRGWRLVVGCAMGAAAAWAVIVGRRWLRARCQGREHLCQRAYRHPRELARDLAAFWYAPWRLWRLRRGLFLERGLLARLALVAVRAAQCACLWPIMDRFAAWLGLDEDEIARLGAGDMAVAEVAQVQALLFAVRYGEQAGHPDEDLLTELHQAYGDETACLIRDWLALVQIVVRVGYTWELALGRLSGAVQGSALGPLVTVGVAFLGGPPLLLWALMMRAEIPPREPAPAEA